MAEDFLTQFKADVIAQYWAQKGMADAALARVGDGTFFTRLHAGADEDTNSVAILVKHLAGNLLSRWTDFLTTDGEKPDRHREREFTHEETDSRAGLMGQWERGWQTLFGTLETLRDEDFTRTVTIRGEPHTVIQAIHRNLLHVAHHVGQLDLLATLLRESGAGG